MERFARELSGSSNFQTTLSNGWDGSESLIDCLSFRSTISLQR